MQMQIRYVRDLNRNFIVNLVGFNQRIIVLPGAFYRIIGANRRTILGTWFISEGQANELGFIVNSVDRKEVAV